MTAQQAPDPKAEACPVCGARPYVFACADERGRDPAEVVGVRCSATSTSAHPAVYAPTLAEAVAKWLALPRKEKP